MQERIGKQSWGTLKSKQSVNWPGYCFCYRGAAAAGQRRGVVRPSVSTLYPPPPLWGPMFREIDDQYVHVCTEVLIMCETSLTDCTLDIFSAWVSYTCSLVFRGCVYLILSVWHSKGKYVLWIVLKSVICMWQNAKPFLSCCCWGAKHNTLTETFLELNTSLQSVLTAANLVVHQYRDL